MCVNAIIYNNVLLMLMYKWNRTYRVREGQVGFFVRVKALFTEHFIDTLHSVHQEVCRQNVANIVV